jgi:hypothetical protein
MIAVINALITGRLSAKLQVRSSKTGSAVATAKVRTQIANGESAFDS